MSQNYETHHRRSIRLEDYDYRQNGTYFVTICTHRREYIFGDINPDGKIILNRFGQIVQEEWYQTAVVRPMLALDAFIVMPNHVHGIIVIVGDNDVVGARRALPLQESTSLMQKTAFGKPVARSLGMIVGGFKSAVSRRINQMQATPDAVVWQRNYYEKIIRTEAMLNDVRQYIAANPINWAFDEYNAARKS